MDAKIIASIFQIAILIMSVSVHEFFHGWMAYQLGDHTAEKFGRLTLNPIKHLDFWGSFVVPAVLILSGSGIVLGWAKPVPYNPRNLRDQKYGSMKVALAGPLSNLGVALIFGLFLRFLSFVSLNPALFEIFAFIVLINIVLAIFNLIPIPPLDGSKVLFTFLPYSMENTRVFLERYGFFIILFIIFFVPFVLNFISVIVFGIFRIITGIPLL